MNLHKVSLNREFTSCVVCRFKAIYGDIMGVLFSERLHDLPDTNLGNLECELTVGFVQITYSKIRNAYYFGT